MRIATCFFKIVFRILNLIGALGGISPCKIFARSSNNIKRNSHTELTMVSNNHTYFKCPEISVVVSKTADNAFDSKAIVPVTLNAINV